MTAAWSPTAAEVLIAERIKLSSALRQLSSTATTHASILSSVDAEEFEDATGLPRGGFTISATRQLRIFCLDATGLPRGGFTISATRQLKIFCLDATGLPRGGFTFLAK
jgi:hypothetical protein